MGRPLDVWVEGDREALINRLLRTRAYQGFDRIFVADIDSAPCVTNRGASTLKVKCPTSTDHLTKEEFDRLRPSRFDSELDYLLELLKHFDRSVACSRNKSFAYFHRRFL